MNTTDTTTHAEAIASARRMLIEPMVHYCPATQREIIAGLLAVIDAHPSFRKAMEKGEEVFVLRQQDRCAPPAIMVWADQAGVHGSLKADSAYVMANRWLANPLPSAKFPD